MPELPEVETVRCGLAPHMEGERFIKIEQRRADLRFPFPENFPERLLNKKIIAMGRRAKYLTVDLDDGLVLIMHLGMSGSFRVAGVEAPQTPGSFHHERGERTIHDHVVFHMSNGAEIIYNDPRRFGFMDLTLRCELENTKPFHQMGVEPTGNSLDASYLAEKLVGKKTPLKAALLDQRIIAGLGNIYVCEALWRAGLSPKRQAGTLVTRSGAPSVRAKRLVTSVRDVIAEAIKAGGSSLKDYVHTDGSLGYFQHSFAVYDREDKKCPRKGCPGTIERLAQSGRSTFFCPHCQR